MIGKNLSYTITYTLFLISCHSSNFSVTPHEILPFHETTEIPFFNDYRLENKLVIETKNSHSQLKKNWTFIIYIAAVNDLRKFAVHNIKQMLKHGSNERINILVHLDIQLMNGQKMTLRYYVDKNKLIHLNENDPHSQSMDSGDEKSLVSCCNWAIKNYPAHHYGLILWNHGTGIIDPARGRIINPSELFIFNPLTRKLELDRSIGFLDFINADDQEYRGICWDSITGNYLTNQKLDRALHEISANILQGKKLDIIGFDACLMSMLEVANIVQPYAEIMLASQEVELGTGWDYARVFEPFLINTLTPQEFARHVVTIFKETYHAITGDYTQSAINLNYVKELEKNLNLVSSLLVEGIKTESSGSVSQMIKLSSNKKNCTHFDEPSYKDLHHFYLNLQKNLPSITLHNKQDEYQFKNSLYLLLEQGKEIIKKMVIANTAGSSLKSAQGISIYFPEKRIHSSYMKTTFAQSNTWSALLRQMLL